MQDRGHVSLLLWGILLVLAWLSCDRLKLCHRGGEASSGHSHGAQAAQSPFPGRAAQAVLGLSLHLLSPEPLHPELSISQLLWDKIPFPFIPACQHSLRIPSRAGQPKLGAGLPPFPN